MPVMITPDHAVAYLQHTIDRVSIRAIALPFDVTPSTIMRRIRRIENLQDCPVWSQVWGQMSRAYSASETVLMGSADWAALLGYIGTDLGEVAAALALADRGPIDRVSILLGEYVAQAPIMRGTTRVSTMPRAAALGLVLIGAARPAPGGSPKVARLTLTNFRDPALYKPAAAPQPPPPPTPARAVKRKKVPPYNSRPGAMLIDQMERGRGACACFTAQHVAIAHGMITAAQADPARFIETLGDLGLGPHLTAVLECLIVDGLGFEATEKRLEWPARACKLVFLIALDFAANRGFLA